MSPHNFLLEFSFRAQNVYQENHDEDPATWLYYMTPNMTHIKQKCVRMIKYNAMSKKLYQINAEILM